MSAEMNPMNTMSSLNDSVQLIHQKLLDLAIRGKLTDQRPDEKLSEEVLSLPEVEGPFEIPDNWKWSKLKYFIDVIAGTSYKKEDIRPSFDGVRIIRGGNVANYRLVIKNDDVYVDRLLISKKQTIQEGDIIIVASSGGANIVGKPAFPEVNQINESLQIGAFLRIIRPKLTEYSAFIKLYFMSAMYRNTLRSLIKGTNIKNVKNSYIEEMFLPVPPLAEQHRIVSVMTDADVMIRSLSSHQKVLQEKIETVQAKVLDLAIRGRLVEQRSEETLSEEVLSLPEVEGPFEIPANWKWSRLKDIGTIVGGGTPSKAPSYWKPEEIAWVKPADFAAIKGKYIRRGQKMISSLGLSKSSARLMPKGSVIYSSRAPIGYVFIAENAISTSQGCKSVVPDFAMVTSDWIYYCLIHATPNIVQRASGTTFKEISGSKFGETLIPVPPLAEQRRICEVIEALQDKCSKLTALLK